MNTKKIYYLDGLRGLAAFIVVIHHLVLAFYPALYNGDPEQSHTSSNLEIYFANSPLNLVYAGNFSVCIFFVLSGFVLSFKYFSTKNNEIIVSSAIRRYFRLLLPVFFSIFLSFVLMKISLYHNNEAATLSFSPWWLGSFWNFEPSFIGMLIESFYGVFFNEEITYNPVLWTIQIELFGSFLVFLFLLIFGKYKFRWIIYTLLFIALWNTYYLGFLLGMFLSDLYFSKDIKLKVFKLNLLIKAALFITSLYLGSYPYSNTDDTIYSILPKFAFSTEFYHIIGAFLLIIFVLESKRTQRMLNNKVCIYLGKISFSMYLIHLLVIGTFSSAFFVFLHSHLQYSLAVLITSLVSILIILIVSYPIYKYIDLKGIKISKIISNFILSKLIIKQNKIK